jgi:NodT family efflux transporter outer membrane factor (OMF) lipoprotein
MRELAQRPRRALALLAAAVAVVAGGCLGPPYKRPPVASPEGFKEAAPAQYAQAPSGTWQPARPQDAALKGKWWQVFNAPELDALEEQLDVSNQNIAQSFQSFMASRAQVNEARASFFPTLTTVPAYSKAHSPGTISPGASAATGAAVPVFRGQYTQITLPFDASWAPDLWGRVRNTVLESRYAAQVSAADLTNERLTEEAALAVYYFELRGQDALQDLYNHTIAAYRESLNLVRALVETGINSEEDLAAAELVLRNAEATGEGIATNRAIYEHAIATLIGKPAGSFSMPVRAFATPVPAVPVVIPSQLLERRPDIAAAERTMAEANALIGVGKAAYFPALNLTASGGFTSSLVNNLFQASAGFWSLGAAASETIIDAGLRKATLAQYRAQYEADVATYRQTVLTAFQQVEDYTSTLRITSRQIERQRAAVQAAKKYLDIVMVRYQTGIDPYLNVMTAQVSLLADQQSEVLQRVSEMVAAVQLIQALGGGWDVSRLPAASEITSQEALERLAQPH